MARLDIQCPHCKKIFAPRAKRSIYCSRSCAARATAPSKLETSRKGGLASAYVQREKRRSKNEAAFAQLCQAKFSSVICNEPVFNGWDADVIIPDLKIAVLWNGKWHYEQIGKHSLSQVQNRDRIKIREISACGYYPYIVKDLGKYDQQLVEEEFSKFVTFAGEYNGCTLGS